MSGAILQTYCGQFTPSDFTFKSTAWIASGFPVNSVFTKHSPTSILDVGLVGDFTSGPAPDVLFLGLFVDGQLVEAAASHVSVAGYFITVDWARPFPASAIAAGAHTLSVRTASASGAPVTLRTSTSIDLTIVEIEAV